MEIETLLKTVKILSNRRCRWFCQQIMSKCLEDYRLRKPSGAFVFGNPHETEHVSRSSAIGPPFPKIAVVKKKVYIPNRGCVQPFPKTFINWYCTCPSQKGINRKKIRHQIKKLVVRVFSTRTMFKGMQMAPPLGEQREERNVQARPNNQLSKP